MLRETPASLPGAPDQDPRDPTQGTPRQVMRLAGKKALDRVAGVVRRQSTFVVSPQIEHFGHFSECLAGRRQSQPEIVILGPALLPISANIGKILPSKHD
jgi:hypothetical protein